MKVLYFSHDCNAMGDNKIDDLRSAYGMEGYGVYWGIVEALSREPDLALPYTQRKATSLKVAMNPSFDMMKFINDCIDFGLFETDGERFWSKSLRGRLAQVVDISQKRSAAALKRWGKNGNKKPETILPKPEEMDTVLDGIDPEWKRVVDAYQEQIGMLPIGTAMENLISYYEDVGADAMIVAIKQTNKDQPDKPYPYLKAILEGFIEKGVKTAEQAEASCNDFDRKRRKWASSQGQKQEQPTAPPDNPDEVRWF